MDREPKVIGNRPAPSGEELDEAADEGLDEIDLTDAASFPASDPPAWASGVDTST